MKYRAYFGFQDQNDQSDNMLMRYGVPISAFAVAGGAWRTISLNSTNDISITSELEQARSYKNITLYMPPAKNHVDMEVAVELMNCASNKTVLLLDFHITKYSGGKKIEELNLVDIGATVKERPSVIGNHLLMIQVALPTASLTNTAYRNNRYVSTAEM